MTQSDVTSPTAGMSERGILLQRLMEQRILVLDGAMGTMIQRHGLEEADYRGERFADWAHDLRGNNDLLSLTQPHLIREIHSAFLDAGADIIETNSFNSTSISMADYHMEELVHELNVASATLARETAGHSGQTPFRRRGPRAHQPYRFNVSRRQRPRVPQRDPGGPGDCL